MKTNHRRVNKPSHDKQGGCSSVSANVKAEARKGRRANERLLLTVIQRGFEDLDDFCAWTKNQHVSDVWSHD